ncbi:hypothetical protein FVE85_5095 [Porphyridium purpureum]|uniref:Uncharacterized protein n=1 Tax=Porphyridium purpureum TaxID=35688 RepID=A0A5J4Z2J4_PORPP|nr:hypothetical protein FVE85_5095 [Porphyridium purpureum]|eukprot:POR5268..scf295_1
MVAMADAGDASPSSTPRSAGPLSRRRVHFSAGSLGEDSRGEGMHQADPEPSVNVNAAEQPLNVDTPRELPDLTWSRTSRPRSPVASSSKVWRTQSSRQLTNSFTREWSEPSQFSETYEPEQDNFSNLVDAPVSTGEVGAISYGTPVRELRPQHEQEHVFESDCQGDQILAANGSALDAFIVKLTSILQRCEDFESQIKSNSHGAAPEQLHADLRSVQARAVKSIARLEKTTHALHLRGVADKEQTERSLRKLCELEEFLRPKDVSDKQKPEMQRTAMTLTQGCGTTHLSSAGALEQDRIHERAKRANDKTDKPWWVSLLTQVFDFPLKFLERSADASLTKGFMDSADASVLRSSFNAVNRSGHLKKRDSLSSSRAARHALEEESEDSDLYDFHIPLDAHYTGTAAPRSDSEDSQEFWQQFEGLHAFPLKKSDVAHA